MGLGSEQPASHAQRPLSHCPQTQPMAAAPGAPTHQESSGGTQAPIGGSAIPRRGSRPPRVPTAAVLRATRHVNWRGTPSQWQSLSPREGMAQLKAHVPLSCRHQSAQLCARPLAGRKACAFHRPSESPRASCSNPQDEGAASRSCPGRSVPQHLTCRPKASVGHGRPVPSRG